MLEQSFLGISLVEIIGYIASIVVFVSLNMTSIVKLRWINLVGAILFAIYGYLITSYPVAIMNLLMAITNIYNLIKLNNIKDNFSIHKTSASDSYLNNIIKFHNSNILKHYPKFTLKNDMICFLIMKNMEAVSIFVGSRNNGNLKIELDYSLSQYRHIKTRNFLYSELKNILQKEKLTYAYCNMHYKFKYSSNKEFLQTKIEGKDVIALKK